MSREKAVSSKSKEKMAGVPASKGTRSRRQPKERLKTSVLEELWLIWRADQRVPSIGSRRLWAASRNASPHLVDSWFLRRRTYAKKAGQSLPEGSYHLPVDPPSVAPKRERSRTLIVPELGIIHDLPSDDTLVYPPDSDDLNDLEASSDTVFDEDMYIEPKGTMTPAYNEVPWRPHSKEHQFQPQPSFADIDAAKDCCDKDTSSHRNSSFLVCNQGRGTKSDFTCILCSKRSYQGTPDEVQPDFGTTSDSRGKASTPCPYPDFFPDTLWELSAIPFLFCTPLVAPHNSAIDDQSVDGRTIVEDELTRLVNAGELDFSFLDDRRLASIELVD